MSQHLSKLCFCTLLWAICSCCFSRNSYEPMNGILALNCRPNSCADLGASVVRMKLDWYERHECLEHASNVRITFGLFDITQSMSSVRHLVDQRGWPHGLAMALHWLPLCDQVKEHGRRTPYLVSITIRNAWQHFAHEVACKFLFRPDLGASVDLKATQFSHEWPCCWCYLCFKNGGWNKGGT